MRSRQALLVTAAAAVVTFLVPSGAVAQSFSQSINQAGSPSFLVAGMAPGQQPATTPPPKASGGGGGIGVGVKGGWLYSSFHQAGESLGSHGGWEAGIFFGGNRGGVVGVMGELLYARKSFDEGVSAKTTDLDYLEIPILLRLNIGSSNKNTGAIFYGLAGPVFDINVKAERDGVDVSDSYEKYDIGLLAGGGLEISRFILEARYNWGLKNLSKLSGVFSDELKTQSFALIAGLRFN